MKKFPRFCYEPRFWRLLVQWLFFAWIAIIGVQFGLFVHHFVTGGVAPFYSRPPGVEGFLPLGALTSLRYTLFSGQFDPLHPAALVLFMTFVAMSLLTKKSFCSWLCPVGTLSELLWKIGQRWLGGTYQIWRWLDIILRSGKYLLLLFFVKLLFFDMPAQALKHFVSSPYWAMSDVKMLHFFTDISMTSFLIILGLTVLSLFYKNFWCRYLCPYGALLGLVSMVSPFKIRRDPNLCIQCQRCNQACPSFLPVAQKKTIRSPECTACLSCVTACNDNALQMALPGVKKTLPRWVFPVLVVALYATGVTIGMVSGHWQTSLTYDNYMYLIPRLKFF